MLRKYQNERKIFLALLLAIALIGFVSASCSTEPLTKQIVLEKMIWNIPELSGYNFGGVQEHCDNWEGFDLRYLNSQDNDQHSEFWLREFDSESDANITFNGYLNPLPPKHTVIKEINGNRIIEQTTENVPDKSYIWISENKVIISWNGNDIGSIYDNILTDLLVEKYLQKFPSTYGCERDISKDCGSYESENKSLIDNPLAFEISYYPYEGDFPGAGEGNYYSIRITNHKDYSLELEKLQLIITGEGHGIVRLQNWAEGKMAPSETKRFTINLGLDGVPGNDACGRDTFTWTLKNRETEESLVSETGVLKCQKIMETGSTTFDLKYILAKEGDSFTLYVDPSHDVAEDSDIYITAGFISPNAVKSWSNNPTNRYPTTFEYDKSVKAYKIGSVTQSELYDRYDVLRIELEYKNDKKEWIIPLDFVPIGKIEKVEPTKDEPIDYKETNISELPSIEEGKEVREERIIYSCSGCELDKKCYLFGFRKEGKFCSDSNNQFIEQQEAESSCENNFECSSNVCVSGKCVSPSLIEKILNWFKRLFDSD